MRDGAVRDLLEVFELADDDQGIGEAFGDRPRSSISAPERRCWERGSAACYSTTRIYYANGQHTWSNGPAKILARKTPRLPDA